jgi:hypothetical protein
MITHSENKLTQRALPPPRKRFPQMGNLPKALPKPGQIELI